jgi:hypothetical protein
LKDAPSRLPAIVPLVALTAAALAIVWRILDAFTGWTLDRWLRIEVFATVIVLATGVAVATNRVRDALKLLALGALILAGLLLWPR